MNIFRTHVSTGYPHLCRSSVVNPPSFGYIVDMLNNYIILQALAQELDKRLRASSILEVYTQRKNELLFSIQTKTSVQEDLTLAVSVNPELNFVYMSDQTARAKKNSIDVLGEVVPAIIRGVAMHPHDRFILLQTDRGLTICFQLFGTAQSNVLLLDEDGTVQRAFKNSRQLEGTRIDVSSKDSFASTLQNLSLFVKGMMEDPARSTFSSLKKVAPFLGSTFAREVLHRGHTDEKARVGDLQQHDIERIWDDTRKLLAEADRPQPIIYYRTVQSRVLSIVPLQHLSGSRAERFDSVNEAARTFTFRSFRSHGIETTKNDLIGKLKRELDRTLRGLHAVEGELSQAGRAEEYDRTAKVLMANLQHLTKGTKFVELDDIFTPGATIRIALEPKLTPVQNAERYFAKTKKARGMHDEVKTRRDSLDKKRSLLERLLLHLDSCETKEQLDAFQHEHTALLEEWHITKTASKEQQLFRVFKVQGDMEVLVGKSSANNDLLTQKFAKPNDLWFHVRGASGSHTVLKVGNNSKPAKEAIHAAARIAAYYSKMRKAGTVPVAYCERKYVRKPKGTNPGSVIMEREKVVFVEPGLPKD